ncbi:hypothetical protein BGX26_009460, partial [Mortierella sp. AD094]
TRTELPRVSMLSVSHSTHVSLSDHLNVFNSWSKSAIQALIGVLLGEVSSVRDSAAKVLGAQLTLSESAIQVLIGALQDEDKIVRYSA